MVLTLGYGSLYNPSYRPNARYEDVGTADQGVHGPAGHPARRGDHGQLQRRAEEPEGGVVRGRRGDVLDRGEWVGQREALTSVLDSVISSAGPGALPCGS